MLTKVGHRTLVINPKYTFYTFFIRQGGHYGGCPDFYWKLMGNSFGS